MKWLIVPLIVLSVLVVLYLTSTRTFEAEIYVEADPEEVWAVLVDERGYEDWNPLLVPSNGKFQQGAKIVYQMTPPEGEPSQFTSEVQELNKYRLIRQFAGMPFILTADHQWILEPVNGGTRVRQYEVDKGIWMWFWDSSWVQPTYEQVNEALKKKMMESK